MPTDAAAAPAAERRVAVLPPRVADQIAAGEVVERPASVVKELVENALDAGARRIDVELDQGGRERIRVCDDGCGMSPEDAVLALKRHATSKLRSLDDLLSIDTLGFRGEALASIAAVARLKLVTRQRGQDEGFLVEVDDEGRIESRPEGAPIGTTIEILNLFARVPARRKFLRSAPTESAHVMDWFGRLALARPEVGFFLRHGGREVLACPAVTRHEERLEQVLGAERARAMVRFEHTEGTVAVRGWTSRAGLSFPSSKQISTWVRARSVRDRVLLRAISDAYRARLPQGRHPIVVAFVELPGSAVDINVHPMKTEVRFAEADQVYACLLRGLRAALDAAAGAPQGSSAAEAEVTATSNTGFGSRVGEALARYAARAPDGGSPGTEPRLRFASPDGERSSGAGLRDRPLNLDPARPGDEGQRTAAFAGATEEVGRERGLPQAGAATNAWPALSAAGWSQEPLSTSNAGAVARFADLRVLGQALRGWIVCEGPDGLILVDQHAAHERIRFERLRAQTSPRLPSQALLVPRVVELDAADVEALLAHREVVLEDGFDVEPFGDGAVIVRTWPAALDVSCDAEALLADLARDLGEIGATERGEAARDALLARIACHGAVRLGDPLELREMQSLLTDLDTIPFAATCPHGRPVLAELSRSEIARRVRRS